MDLPKGIKQVFMPLVHVELEYILMVLHANHGCKTKTAKALGISRATLYRKLNFYSLEQDQRIIK